DAPALADLLPLDRWGSVTHVESGASGALPLADDSADLVMLAGGVRSLAPARRAEIARILRPEGLLWAELGGPLGWLRRDEMLAALRADFSGAALYWLSPLSGEVHTVVPLTHAEPRRFFLDRRLYSVTITLQRLKRIRRRNNGARPKS